MRLLSPRDHLSLALVLEVALNDRQGVKAMSAKEFARFNDMPPRYMETVFQALVHERILLGKRGPQGGYVLARAAHRIKVYDVIMITQGLAVDKENKGSNSKLTIEVVLPAVDEVARPFIIGLQKMTVADLMAAHDLANPEKEKAFA